MIIVIFILIILGLAIVLSIFRFFSKQPFDSHNDEAYYDENGHHVYYERSIIEKREFHKKNPDMQYSDIRSFKNLLKRSSVQKDKKN